VRLTEEALGEGDVSVRLHVARDGVEAVRLLRQNDSTATVPRPDLVLLDLNLPRKGGFEVLEEMKNDKELRRIPVIVLTTSKEERDILRAYDLHANGFIVKPVDLDEFIRVVRSVSDFWLTVATLPPK
jgi:CheY-like chemotaxis protein